MRRVAPPTYDLGAKKEIGLPNKYQIFYKLIIISNGIIII